MKIYSTYFITTSSFPLQSRPSESLIPFLVYEPPTPFQVDDRQTAYKHIT